MTEGYYISGAVLTLRRHFNQKPIRNADEDSLSSSARSFKERSDGSKNNFNKDCPGGCRKGGTVGRLARAKCDATYGRVSQDATCFENFLLKFMDCLTRSWNYLSVISSLRATDMGSK